MTQPSDLVIFLAIIGMFVIAGIVVVWLDRCDEQREMAARETAERPRRIAELERELGIGEPTRRNT